MEIVVSCQIFRNKKKKKKKKKINKWKVASKYCFDKFKWVLLILNHDVHENLANCVINDDVALVLKK